MLQQPPQVPALWGRPHLLQCRLVVRGPPHLGLPHQSLPRLPGSGGLLLFLRQRISVVLLLRLIEVNAEVGKIAINNFGA